VFIDRKNSIDRKFNFSHRDARADGIHIGIAEDAEHVAVGEGGVVWVVFSPLACGLQDVGGAAAEGAV